MLFTISCSDSEESVLEVAENQENQTEEVEINIKKISEINNQLLNEFNNRYYSVAQKDGKFFYLDENCKRISDKVYDNAKKFSQGMAAVSIDGKWGFINPKEDLVYPLKFDKARSFSDGMAAVSVDGKWGFLNREGDLIFPLKNCDDVGDFSDGLCWVSREIEYTTRHIIGYIDKFGKQVLPFNYSQREDFYNGAVYQKDYENQSKTHESYYYFIDKNGDKVLDGQKRPNDMFFSAYGTIVKKGSNKITFKYGRRNRTKYGIKDSMGYTIIDAQFGDIGEFTNGIAPAQAYGRPLGEIGRTGVGAWEYGLWGIIDENGQWIIEPEYASISSLHCVNKCFEVISDTSNIILSDVTDQFMDSTDTTESINFKDSINMKD